jgi:hypothetical protein
LLVPGNLSLCFIVRFIRAVVEVAGSAANEVMYVRQSFKMNPVSVWQASTSNWPFCKVVQEQTLFPPAPFGNTTALFIAVCVQFFSKYSSST